MVCPWEGRGGGGDTSHVTGLMQWCAHGEGGDASHVTITDEPYQRGVAMGRGLR